MAAQSLANTDASVASLLRPDVSLREVAPGIFSALPERERGAPYDTKAFVYDLLIGSWLYNRIVWGSSPREYAAFANEALGSGTGWLIELAGGSCLASAAAYARTQRPVAVVDRSLGMLRRARARLLSRAGGAAAAAHVVFVQADVFALPFRPGVADTVLSLGALHLFSDATALVRAADELRAPGGRLFFTSLVRGRWLSTRALRALHAAGEVASPRTFAEARELVAGALAGTAGAGTAGAGTTAARHGGAMAYFTVA